MARGLPKFSTLDLKRLIYGEDETALAAADGKKINFYGKTAKVVKVGKTYAIKTKLLCEKCEKTQLTAFLAYDDVTGTFCGMLDEKGENYEEDFQFFCEKCRKDVVIVSLM